MFSINNDIEFEVDFAISFLLLLTVIAASNPAFAIKK